MHWTEGVAAGGGFAVILGLVEVVKIYAKKHNGKKGASVLTSAERKCIYDTERHAAAQVDIAKSQTKILTGVDKTLAVMDERQGEIRTAMNKIATKL